MPATLLTVAQLREHVETDLPDSALQRILDSEEGEIVRRYGPHVTATETLSGGREWPHEAASGYPFGGGEFVVLGRQASAIVSILETVGGVATLLDPTDYLLWEGYRLQRLPSGTHPQLWWGERAVVTYTPVDQVAQRTLVLVNLVKLALQNSGLRSESMGGDHSETTLDYVTERERLLRSLAPRGGFVFA